MADVILSPGSWDAQETNLLIYWNWMYFGCYMSWIIFLSHSFSPLFTDAPFVVPELFPLMGADVYTVSSMSALTYKGQQWSEMERKKGTH